MKNKITIQDLLFNDQPITINRKLAKCLGLKEAVIFQQIHYWLEINKKTNNNFKENRYWTYNSIKKWQENEFDFLSERTVERTIKKLENDGLIISKTFNKMRGDKTKWYSIDYDKLLEVCEKKLNDKDLLSAKRSLAGKKGAATKKIKIKDPIQPTWQNGGAYNQLGSTIQPTWQNDTTNLAEAIPKITTKTSTKITNSSSNNESLIDIFENNICKLGKITKNKFLKLIENESKEYIEAVIEYQTSISTKSYAGFEKGFKNFESNNIHTVEDLKIFLENYNKTKSKKVYKKNIKTQATLRFNNFKHREYDYDILEKKLLKWTDEEIAKYYDITIEEVKERSKGIM